MFTLTTSTSLLSIHSPTHCCLLTRLPFHLHCPPSGLHDVIIFQPNRLISHLHLMLFMPPQPFKTLSSLASMTLVPPGSVFPSFLPKILANCQMPQVAKLQPGRGKRLSQFHTAHRRHWVGVAALGLFPKLCSSVFRTQKLRPAFPVSGYFLSKGQ